MPASFVGLPGSLHTLPAVVLPLEAPFHTVEANYQTQEAFSKGRANAFSQQTCTSWHSNPVKGNGAARFNQSTSCAGALCARSLRCPSARPSHPSQPPSARCLEDRLYEPASATAVLICMGSMASELRESVTRNKARLLLARMTASDSVRNKREHTLLQRAKVVAVCEPFSILHSHSQSAIPWSPQTGSVNLHDASGLSSAESLSCFITRARTTQKLHRPANYPHKLTKAAEPWLGGGAASGGSNCTPASCRLQFAPATAC